MFSEGVKYQDLPYREMEKLRQVGLFADYASPQLSQTTGYLKESVEGAHSGMVAASGLKEGS